MQSNLKEKLSNHLHKSNSKQLTDSKSKGINCAIYESSSYLSKLFFLWVISILKLSTKTRLSPSLLGSISPQDDSNDFSSTIEYHWESKKAKCKSHNALMKAILRVNFIRFTKALMLSLISSILQFVSILLLKEYINYFQYSDSKRFSLLQIGMMFIVTQFIYLLISNHVHLNLSLMGFRAKNELNCFIYNKLLKISPSSFLDKTSHGEIINFLQVDSNKLSHLMYISPNFITSPIMICAYMYLLFDFFGISFFTGLAILAFFFLLNFFLFKHYRIVSKELLEKTDGRMKLTTEVFDSIKILKLYNWENEFKQRIFSAREEEVQKIKKRLMMSTVNISLYWLCPVFVAIGTIGVYIFLEHSFDIATMLIGLALFARLQNPVRDLPWSINALLETYISMGRIEKFINQPEYVESNVVIENKNEKPYAIKIENGTFTWGKNTINEVNTSHHKHAENFTKELKERKRSLSNICAHYFSDNQNGNNRNSHLEEYKNLYVSREESITQSETCSESVIKSQYITENNSNKEIEGVDKKDYEIVLSDINLEVKQGETVGIIGEVGSGKTSLLQAILNSLILLSKDKCDGIHIAGSIGYVSQTPWIQNDTIKNNIIFFNEYNEDRYQQVLEQSQLKHDLNNLEGHDMTEIGEKGINLSGGQKVRVSLARALYADPDIYLLDDPISALDANIGRQIIDGCILKYLKNKTRLITTHALYFLRNLDKIIYIEKGQIKWSGTYDELIYQDFYAALSRMEKQRNNSCHKNSLTATNSEENEEDSNKEDISNHKEEITKRIEIEKRKKLAKEEDQEIGAVKAEVYIKYCYYMGGISFVFTITIIMLLWAINKCSSDMWIAYWSESTNQDLNKKIIFFLIYSAIGIGSSLFIFFRILLLSLGTVKLSRLLHKDMITHLIKAPINLFHDIIPRSQLFNRLSTDLENLQDIMYTVGNMLVALYSVLSAIIICSIYDFYSLLFIPFFGIIGYYLISFYLIGKRSLSRIERSSCSPILNTISETIPGVITIKAFGKCKEYIRKYNNGINDNYKVNLFCYGSDTWFCFVLNIISFLFVVYLVAYTTIYEKILSPQSIGLMFTYSLILQDSLEGFFLFCTTLETQMVSMERCLSYTRIIKENASSVEEDEQLIQQSWPQAGKIEFVNYSVKYRPNTEMVLKSLSFIINPREKIGIIGRTGSGKSTICLCLFRILEPLAGTINIDDVDITKVGLDLLRRNITIIPQDPTLMQGTLRYNIDPFDTRTDEEILTILHDIGFNINDNADALQKVIEEKGNNLSVGERQLVCIARAMLRVSIAHSFIIHRKPKSY